MRNFILICFAIAYSLSACNNNKAKNGADEATNDKSLTEAVPENEADVILKREEAMKKLTPFNPDQIKALFPDELIGMKRADYKPINTEGYEVGEASYNSD